jgi:hypothetical protein
MVVNFMVDFLRFIWGYNALRTFYVPFAALAGPSHHGDLFACLEFNVVARSACDKAIQLFRRGSGLSRGAYRLERCARLDSLQ